MSLILQRYNPGLSDEDRNTSTIDRSIELSFTSPVINKDNTLDTKKGKKHIERSKKIYSMVCHRFLVLCQVYYGLIKVLRYYSGLSLKLLTTNNLINLKISERYDKITKRKFCNCYFT